MTPEQENARLRERVEELEETVRQLRAAVLPVVPMPDWMPNLTYREEGMMRLLISRRIVSKDTVSMAFYNGNLGCESLPSIFVMNLRRKLAGTGVNIKTSRGRGYYLDAAVRDKLRMKEAV